MCRLSLVFHRLVSLLMFFPLTPVEIVLGNQTPTLCACSGFPDMLWPTDTADTWRYLFPPQLPATLAKFSRDSQTQQPLDAPTIATWSWQYTLPIVYHSATLYIQYAHMVRSSVHTTIRYPTDGHNILRQQDTKQEEALTRSCYCTMADSEHAFLALTVFLHSFCAGLLLPLWSLKLIHSSEHDYMCFRQWLLLFIYFSCPLVLGVSIYTALSLMDTWPELSACPNAFVLRSLSCARM